jgi:uncharacterized protein with FMN-binding domain
MIKSHQKKALTMVILISLIFGSFLIFVAISSRLDDISNTIIEEISFTNVEDGTYNGISDTSPVFIDINVKIVNHEIRNIEVNYTNIFINDNDLNLLINEIYEKQSINFDHDAYDLYTSIALFDAVYNAIS